MPAWQETIPEGSAPMPGVLTPLVFMRNITQGEPWRLGQLPGMGGMTLFPIVQGSDTDFTVNFGPFDNPTVTENTDLLPDLRLFGLDNLGYGEIYPGWRANPGTGRGFTALDPARIGGSAVVAGSRITCPTIYGACQASDGWAQGGWYFTMRNNANTLFNNFGGGGAGRAFPGIDFSFWGNGGEYGPLDNLGGGMILGGHFNTYLPRLFSEGVLQYATAVPWQTGELMGFAVSMGAFDASVTYDGPLVQQPMPCVPCCNPCL